MDFDGFRWIFYGFFNEILYNFDEILWNPMESYGILWIFVEFGQCITDVDPYLRFGFGYLIIPEQLRTS